MGMGKINNGSVAEGLVESNSHSQDDLRDKARGRDQVVFEEDDFHIDEDFGSANIAGMEMVQASRRLQIQNHVQGIRWEAFLNRRSLNVLLVENDDSTRHVVSALLQNCGYEVTAVSNGLQAWKILEDVTNRIDLVLAEVVLPSLSGIGLLSKIMSHKPCKIIPFIMMSSYDSVNVVFKCLSKGAVDFLVKPIRKNELKNLWQHVWRKCHSDQSSGSGSESGTEPQNSGRSDGIRGSENNTGSKNGDDNGSMDINVKDGSDHGSATQSSWTKRTLNVDRPQTVSLQKQSVDPSHGRCNSVVLSVPEPFSNNGVPLTTNRECKGHYGRADHTGRVPRNPYIQHEDPGKKTVNVLGNNDKKAFKPNSTQEKEKLEKGLLELHREDAIEEPNGQATGLEGINAESARPQAECVGFDVRNILSKETEKVLYDTEEALCLDRSLDWLRNHGDKGTTHPDQDILRCSGVSAFPRYKNASTSNQGLSGNVSSCYPFDNTSDTAKPESARNLQSNSTHKPLNECCYVSSNDNDMGCSTNSFLKKPAVLNDNPVPSSRVKCLYPSVDRLRNNRDKGATDPEPNILRHSGVSAFSRYKTASTANQAPTGHGGSSPLDNSSDAAKPESVQNLQSYSSDKPLNQCYYICSDNNDMSSSTNNFHKEQAVPNENQVPSSTVKCLYPSSAFQPVQNSLILSIQPPMQGEVDVATAKTFLIQASRMHQQMQVQHHHHYYQHCHQPVRDMPSQQKGIEYDDISSKIMAAAAPACGSSNVRSTSTEGNTMNCSLNGSASGINNGNNGQNRCSNDINDRENNLERNLGITGYSEAGDRISYNAFEQKRSALREAALHRFRQKRKQRCFERKVRYQSRKKLAEQRPRVRGQFVRQMD